MSRLSNVRIFDASGQQVGFDDEGTYDRATKTVDLSSVRWAVADPSALQGQQFTLKARFTDGSGDFINDMTLQPGAGNFAPSSFVGT